MSAEKPTWFERLLLWVLRRPLRRVLKSIAGGVWQSGMLTCYQRNEVLGIIERSVNL